MLRASVSVAKARLSELLDRVRRGESVLITDRGRPVARLVPVVPVEGESDGALERLERDGVIRRQLAPLPAGFLRGELPEPEASAVEALVREREEGR
ncbi:type II toxin-antitoxin system prevent-host-death family antitoxin [Candidatus Bipolaricaulota bacterium]|nr:type II toxin-antitoxin system prevent-host-death family antitoxin [Candidatus Bipolaricaulota bacterium]